MTSRSPHTRPPHRALLRRLTIAVVLVAAFATGRPDRTSGQTGPAAGALDQAKTGIQLQNVDMDRPATFTARLWKYGGIGFPVDVSRPSIPPGGAANLYLPTMLEPTNGLFALAATADRPIAAIARTDFPITGAAAAYTAVTPGTDLFLPLAVAAYYGWNSVVAIQNTDDTQPAAIRVTYRADGQAVPAAERAYAIAPGSGILLDLAEELADVPPNTPAGFLGSLRVTSAVPVGVMSFVERTLDKKPVYAFEGGPASGGGRQLFAPVAQNTSTVGSRPEHSTGIAVANPNATAVDVTIAYRGSDGACAGQTFRDGPNSIPAYAGAVFYQPASKSLPRGCRATAVIEADGVVHAVVVDSENKVDQAAAYTAVPASQGAKTVLLPLVRRRHTRASLTTAIDVMNIGDAAADVRVRFFDSDGRALDTCGTGCRVTVQPLAAATFVPGPALDALPSGTYGSAVVTSDQPVVAIVTDASESGTIDMATYNGINGDASADPADGPASHAAYVTFAARNATVR